MERYIICHDSDGKKWFLCYDKESKEPLWATKEEVKNYGLLVYSDYNEAKRLLAVIRKEEEPDAYITIINF